MVLNAQFLLQLFEISKGEEKANENGSIFYYIAFAFLAAFGEVERKVSELTTVVNALENKKRVLADGNYFYSKVLQKKASVNSLCCLYLLTVRSKTTTG